MVHSNHQARKRLGAIADGHHAVSSQTSCHYSTQVHEPKYSKGAHQDGHTQAWANPKPWLNKYWKLRLHSSSVQFSSIFFFSYLFLSPIGARTRIPGLSQITWWIVMTKNWGATESGQKNFTKIEKSFFSKRRGCGSTRTFDSRLKWAHSWNQIKTLKECLCCHIYCAHCCLLMFETVIAYRTVSNRESRYPETRKRRYTKTKIRTKHTNTIVM